VGNPTAQGFIGKSSQRLGMEIGLKLLGLGGLESLGEAIPVLFGIENLVGAHSVSSLVVLTPGK
jgi:hypothetical protein